MVFLKFVGQAAVISLFIGCTAQPDHHSVPKNASARWKKGGFSVVFRAGPKPFGEEKSYSSFEIARQFEGLSGPTTIVVESAQDIDYFRRSPKNKPKDFIKLFTSDSGLTLLIEEIVPNECAPCANYILVRANEHDEHGRQLDCQYVAFPPGRIQSGGTWPDMAEITKLGVTNITFWYRDGIIATKPFIALKKRDQRPTFPG